MATLFTEYDKNVSPHEDFVGADALPLGGPSSYPVMPIAFYLPQFHAIDENDQWWGKGFTEWTNVTKALPRYVGHLQPRLPADLGFYNLSDVQVLRRQADLVKRSGVYGLCIHDYWFSGRKLLDAPLRLLLEHRDIDLRFCLNWANESWSRRWDGSENDILVEQRYLAGDPDAYASSILPAIRDPRYIRVEGRPLILVYRPSLIPDAPAAFECWRRRIVQEGEGNPYLVMVQSFGDADPRPYGLDAATSFPPHNVPLFDKNDRDRLSLLDRSFAGHARSYAWLREQIQRNRTNEYRWFPGVCPSWDNEARKPRRGHSFYNSNPAAFEDWLSEAAAIAAEAPPAERFLFINAWNEWAEGALVEPDRHYGFGNLAAIRNVVDRLSGVPRIPRRSGNSPRTRPSWLNFVKNMPARVVRRLWRRAR